MTVAEQYAEADWWAARAAEFPDELDEARVIASLLRLEALHQELAADRR